MVSDQRLDDMNFQALFEVQEMFVFVFALLYGRFAIHRTSLYSIRFNASVSYLTTRMIDCSLNRQSFCLNYAIFWAKLEVMVITLEPRTSNIAGRSRKYTNGYFICFDMRSTALSLLDMFQVGVIVFYFYWRPIHFSHTILSLLTTQCTSAPCMTNADCSVQPANVIHQHARLLFKRLLTV